MRLRHVVLVAPALVAAACFGGASTNSVGQTRLTVVVHRKTAEHRGTRRGRFAVRRLAAPIRTLGRHAPSHCATEIGGPWTTVNGVYAGEAISLAYVPAAAFEVPAAVSRV
jgi:hypothetical protein